MSHEESGTEYPKAYITEILRMDNSESDTTALLFKFNSKVIAESKKCGTYYGKYVLQLLSDGDVVTSEESDDITRLNNIMINFITETNWVKSKQKVYAPL